MAKGTGHPSYARLNDQFRKNPSQKIFGMKIQGISICCFLATSFLEVKVTLEIK